LRLVLDAQSGGASGVVLVPEAETARPALADERRRIPVLDSVPPDSAEVRVPASYLVHRQLFKKLFEQGAMPRDLAREPFEIDVPWGFSSFDVSDGQTARAAERALFRSLRKPEDGWTSRALNRPISLSLSRLLVKTPLTPNQVSLGILAVGIV